MKVPLKVYLVLLVRVRFVVVFYSRPELQEAYRLAMISIQLSSCFLNFKKTNGVTSCYIDIVTSLVYFDKTVSMFCCIFVRFWADQILKQNLIRSFEVGPRVTMRHSREPMNSSCRRGVLWNSPTRMPHETCSKLEAVEKGGRRLNRKDFHHSRAHSLLENQVTQFFPRTWGAKTIPRRSLTASSRGKIQREWQSCLEMSRSRVFGWTRDITMVPQTSYIFSCNELMP